MSCDGGGAGGQVVRGTMGANTSPEELLLELEELLLEELELLEEELALLDELELLLDEVELEELELLDEALELEVFPPHAVMLPASSVKMVT